MADNDRPLFNRRLFCLGLVKGLTFGFLGLRLYHLQLVEGKKYRALSDKRRILLQVVPAPRGEIQDRTGTILALQQNAFQAHLTLDKKQPYCRSLLLPLVPILGLSAKDLEAIEESPDLIKPKLSWAEVAWLEGHKHRFPYITIKTLPIRVYPFAYENAHIIGYVSMAKKSPEIPADIHEGKSGLEKAYDAELAGKRGYQTLEVNAHNQVVRKLESISACPGTALRLSLYQPLQAFVYQRLADYQSAAAVVMQIDTGEILSMVSYPSFDPNAFSHRLPKVYWQELMLSPYAPLVNKAISGLYSPGSTVKIATALAGLTHGLIGPQDAVHCSGSFKIGTHRFHCWKRGGHGTLSVAAALTQSCDVFFYQLAARLGIGALNHTFSLLGLGEILLPECAEAKGGLLPDPSWKGRVRQKKWTTGDTILSAIGQGALLTTPLHLAVMAARIASGRKVMPTCLYQSGPQEFAPLAFSSAHRDLICKGLYQVVNSPLGTAYAYRPQEENFTMAGKTATTQVRRISAQERRARLTTTHHLPWKYREHSLFCGYAPAAHPRYSIAVLLEHGIQGAPAVAADIFTFMAQQGLMQD